MRLRIAGSVAVCICAVAVGAAAHGQTGEPVAAGAVRDASQPASLRIDDSRAAGKVSPTLYGLMTEEINYSYEGGLYAELVQDRTFLSAPDDTENWVPVPFGSARGAVSRDRTTGPSAAINWSEKLSVTAADAQDPFGLRNHGWWGVALHPNTTYTGSVWAKSDTPGGALKVSLVGDDTGKVLAEAQLPPLTGEWKQYPFTLKTGAMTASAKNQILVSVEKPGTVWLQQLSVFPPTYHNTPNGFRTDLMELMAGMHPTFLRMPGGNYLEGDHISERFDWKKTIGPLIDRAGHRSPWNYHSTDGMGLLEFLNWCQDLNMQPVLAVYAGYSLRQEHVDPGPALEPYVQDALDEIEYVTGDTSTKWGTERAKDGHPAPFPLNYVEIGNEDFFDRSKSYDGRYAQFYDAIKKKYPNLQLIATAPVKGHVVDVLDDHYYKRAEQFFADVHHYDHTDRNGPKIFVGEWATREGSPTTNMGAALGDAAWMTGLERNSDIIVMSSYAPLLVNVDPGGMQWKADLIGYDAFSSYGSPGYYAQAMFAGHLGTEILSADLTNAGDRLFESVTRDPGKGVVYVKLVNASSVAQPVKITLDGAKDVKGSAHRIRLSGATTAETNSITDPRQVVPIADEARGMGKEFTETVPAYTVEVLDLQAR
jgi:alpha-N-arabinofuranosidase